MTGQVAGITPVVFLMAVFVVLAAMLLGRTVFGRRVYAIGTGLGGIIGPLLFASFINSGKAGQVELAFLLGAAVMAVGGVAEFVLGVNAEGQTLENIAKPLTAEDTPADSGTGSTPLAAT